VKEWLKSALNYQSYSQNKTGYPFLDHPLVIVYTVGLSDRSFCVCSYIWLSISKKNTICYVLSLLLFVY